MTLYDTTFWSSIVGARSEFGARSYYDHETKSELEIPGKDAKKYPKAIEYCDITLDAFISLAETVEEIKLIHSQIQHSQDFALQHKEFKTDLILRFSYKNWIIRINILAEQLISLVNQVYRLKLSDNDLINQIFDHSKVVNDKVLYFALLNLVDFLHDKILLEVNTKSIRRARNEIVHNANFRHNVIELLSSKIFGFKFRLGDIKDSEDLYLEEGMTSEQIKKEVLDLSNQFLDRYFALDTLFAEEFERNMKLLTL